jgi:hypothetical protein
MFSSFLSGKPSPFLDPKDLNFLPAKQMPFLIHINTHEQRV